MRCVAWRNELCFNRTNYEHHQSRKDEGSSKGKGANSSGVPSVPRPQVNKYTGRPFTPRFWEILQKRKTLPVWDYYTKFIDLVKKNQCVVLVGETGSGKTTQVWGSDTYVCMWTRVISSDTYYVCMWTRVMGRSNVDTTVVDGDFTVNQQEGCSLHPAPSSGCHECSTTCVRRNGCTTGTRGGLQHTIWGLYQQQDHSQVVLTCLPWAAVVMSASALVCVVDDCVCILPQIHDWWYVAERSNGWSLVGEVWSDHTWWSSRADASHRPSHGFA